MQIRKLRRTHECFDAALLEKHRDLFGGGKSFRDHIARYLPQHEQEPAHLYSRRCQLGADEYVNYCGPICNYFASWLFTSAMTFKMEPEQSDGFYEQFRGDCDGDGTSLDHFMRSRFIDAVQDQRVYWRVQFPEAPPEGAGPRVLAEWQAIGLGRAVLSPVPASSITNWRRDQDGIVWLVEYESQTGLEEPGDDEPTTVETWTVWRRDGQHRRFETRYTARSKPSDEHDAPEVELPNTWGQIDGIPIVEMCLPDELWVMGLIASPQLANFRKRAGLSWAIDRTCYAMPIFKLRDKRRAPAMGAGYYLMIGADESVEYAAPPAAPFSVIKEFTAEIKDEIHRVASQMARGVDNNAAAIGRSGQSKMADDLATEIVLAAYGMHVRDAVERTLDLVSDGRGENITHTVGGMSTYHVTDAHSFAELAVASTGLNIPSATHHREVAKRQSQLMLPDADESVRKKINDEIEKGITGDMLEVAHADLSEPGLRVPRDEELEE